MTDKLVKLTDPVTKKEYYVDPAQIKLLPEKAKPSVPTKKPTNTPSSKFRYFRLCF